MVRDRLERQDCFTGFLHGGNVLFESLRGDERAKLPSVGHNDCGRSAACVVTPKTLPIQVLSLTSAATEPIAITLLAVATPTPAPAPKAVLPSPEVLFTSALAPMAVFELPVVLLARC